MIRTNAIVSSRILLYLLPLLSQHVAIAQFVETELVFDAPIDSRLSLPDFAGAVGAILLTGRSEDRRKHISIYQVFTNGSVSRDPMINLELSDDVLFFDTGYVHGARTLLLLSANDVLALEPVTGELSTLLSVQSVYRTASTAPLSRLEFMVDVNEDGLDDIVLPDFDGLRVVLQTDDGFSPPILLDITVVSTVSRFKNKILCQLGTR